MKIDNDNNASMTRGAHSKTEFTIDNSAIAFTILSGKLYSNKTAAIIRELSTNAIDAHIDAGTLDKPFDVQIPTRVDPTFRIRDYGTGMSQDTIRSLYTTYFRSNKNDDNTKTGAFGLGSKSPFSYAKSFTVTSYYEGEKTLWVAMVGPEGTPVINMMSAEPTTQPNGVEIKFPVALPDINQWTQEAQNIYKWFKYPPSINIAIDKVTYSRDGGWWKLMKSGGRDSYGYSRSYDQNGIIVMGNVSYPVPSWRNIIIYCEIGDVDITPNREQLEMTPKTEAALKRLYDKAKQEINKVLLDEFDKCKSKYEAILRHNDILENVPSEHRLSTYTYKGQPISNNVNYPASTLQITLYNNKCRKQEHKGSWRVNTEEKLMLADSSYHMLRIKNYLIAHHSHKIILLDKDEVAPFLIDLGLDMSSVILTSSLPKPVINRTANGSVKREAFTYEALINGQKVNHEVDEELFEDGGVYIEMKGGQPVIADYWSVLEALQVIGTHDPILLINQVQIGKFKKHDAWKVFDESQMVIMLEKAITNNKNLYNMLVYDAWIGGGKGKQNYRNLSDLAKAFQKPELTAFVHKVAQIKLQQKVSYSSHNRFMAEATKKLLAKNPLVVEYNAIESKYPCLKLLDFMYENPEAYRILATLA